MQKNIGIFCVVAMVLLASCANEKTRSAAERLDASLGNKGKSLFAAIKKVEYNDLRSLKTIADSMSQIKNDSIAVLLGEYYGVKAAYLQEGICAQRQPLESYYEKIKDMPLFESVRMEIDLELILRAYMRGELETASQRIKYTMDYIYKEEYELQRLVLIYGLSKYIPEKDLAKKIGEIEQLTKTPLLQNQWTYHSSLIYKRYAEILMQAGREKDAFEVLEYMIKKEKGAALLTEVAQSYSIYGWYKSMGSLRDFNESKALINKSISYALKSGNPTYIPISYTRLGHVYMALGEFKKGLGCYSTSAKYDASLNCTQALAFSVMYQGYSYFFLDPEKNYEASLKYYENALRMDHENDKLKLHILQRKMWSLNNLGREKESKEIRPLINDLRTEIEHKDNINKILDFENQLELRFNDMNARIDNLRISNQLKDERLLQSRYLLSLSIAVTSLLFLLVYSYFKRVKFLQKIEEQKILIESKNKDLEALIQQLKNNEAALNHANSELKTLLGKRELLISRLRNFASVLAHDFKEPARTIVSFGSFLKKTAPDKLDDRENEFFNFIISSTERLKIMVDRLYKYSNNSLALLGNFVDVDLNEVVQKVKADLAVRISEKQATLEADQLHIAQGDEVLIYQLFQNLIANSLKYHKEKLPPIIRIGNFVNESNELVIYVSDNGLGIQTKPNFNIFSLFVRANEIKEKEGLGVGLATCKEIVEIHGGKIWYKSEHMAGTTFYFSLKDFKLKTPPSITASPALSGRP